MPFSGPCTSTTGSYQYDGSKGPRSLLVTRRRYIYLWVPGLSVRGCSSMCGGRGGRDVADCTSMGDELAISIKQWVLFYILKSRPPCPPRLLTSLPFHHCRPLNSEGVMSISSPEAGSSLSPGSDIRLSGACCYPTRPVAPCLGVTSEQELGRIHVSVWAARMGFWAGFGCDLGLPVSSVSRLRACFGGCKERC